MELIRKFAQLTEPSKIEEILAKSGGRLAGLLEPGPLVKHAEAIKSPTVVSQTMSKIGSQTSSPVKDEMSSESPMK